MMFTPRTALIQVPTTPRAHRRMPPKLNFPSDRILVLFSLVLLLSPISSNFVHGNLGLALDGRSNGQCPVECACLGNVVDCSGLQLMQAPSGLPPWTETLELKDNNIAHLQFDLLHLSRLKELDLSSNKLGNNFTEALSDLSQLRGLKANKNLLTRIPDVPFLPNLTQLTLSHNTIGTINGTALRALPDLQNLDLSANKIRVLKRGSFLAPNRITHLNLNMNEMLVMENGCLDNLTSLEELRLNRNGLTQLVKEVFTNLTSLRVLEVIRNELQMIQGLSLKNLTRLEELRLKRNKIELLEDGAFWPLKNLVLLQLDHNLLTVVKKGGLFGLEHLQRLTLSHNRITNVEAGAWEICKEITELDLSSNRLTSIDRGTLEFLGKLQKLRINHNRITYIADGAFNNTPNLQVLELNNNKISYMVEDINGAFVPLGQLSKLGLASNQIKSVNKNAFTGLSRLSELDLVGNNITSIQENAFAPMPSLLKLRMNTGALVCDCGLQWLSVWLRSHRYSEAKARCGYPDWLRDMPLINLHNANFTCDEFPKPRILEGPAGEISSIRGDNVSLTCRATSTADTPLHFTWKHENLEVRDAQLGTFASYSARGITEASSILHLVNVTHSHAGRYQCMVANTYGTTYSAKATISVLVYPSFSMIPHDIQVTAGSTARLECSAKGQPSPQIAWQKDGGNDFPAARERRMHMDSTDPVLLIVNVKTADGGVYSCTAQNDAGLIVANATLTILEPPSFGKPMKDKEIMAGVSVVLECMASGSPRPKLSWRKNGSPLQATERHFFTAEDQLFIIVNTIPSDAGSYECEISNSLGSVVGSSQLTINPAPASMSNDDDMLGLIIITVVCCAVGTSIVWVVIIYQTRKRLNGSLNNSERQQQPPSSAVNGTTTDGQTHLYLDTSSQHSKDSGTGDSTNPSSDQLQLCLPEEIVTCATSNEEETALPNGQDPLLRYTNHERHVPIEMEDDVP